MTIDEFLWGGTAMGFVAAALVLVAGTVFGFLLGRAVEGPRAKD